MSHKMDAVHKLVTSDWLTPVVCKCHVNSLWLKSVSVWRYGAREFLHFSFNIQLWANSFKVSKVAKIKNRCSHVPHLTQDTNGKVTNSQLDTTNESQEVSPFSAGDHKAYFNRCAQRNDPQKKCRLGTVSKNILLEGLNRFNGANLTLNSDVDQDIDIWFA